MRLYGIHSSGSSLGNPLADKSCRGPVQGPSELSHLQQQRLEPAGQIAGVIRAVWSSLDRHGDDVGPSHPALV
eukprot:scaffold678825_cov45-Prasinocladus_malaysianus.AAC.1